MTKIPICRAITSLIIYGGNLGAFGYFNFPYLLKSAGRTFAYAVAVMALWGWVLLALFITRYYTTFPRVPKYTEDPPLPSSDSQLFHHQTDVPTHDKTHEEGEATFSRKVLVRNFRMKILIRALCAAIVPGCLLLGLYSYRLAYSFTTQLTDDANWLVADCTSTGDYDGEAVVCLILLTPTVAGVVSVCWLFLDIYLSSRQSWRSWKKNALRADETEMPAVRVVPDN